MKTPLFFSLTLLALLAAGRPTESSGGGLARTTAPFPAVSSVAPRGSLVYDAQTVARISVTGQVDEFTLALDAGQTLTVVMSPESSGLHADVEVLAPDSTELGRATGSGAGLDAVIQTVPVAAAGTYMIRASGLGGTIGNYSLRGILNAAAEHEHQDGPANDSQVTAQDLDGSSLGLGGNATRLAVLGAMPGATLAEDWYAFSATAGQVLGIHLAQLTEGSGTVDVYDGNGSWLAHAMPDGNSGFAISRLQAPDSGFYYVRVTGSDASYDLIIVRDIVFDTEPNEPPAAAQEEWPAGMALGAVETAGARDGYRVSANVGDLLVAYTDTPSDSSGEFDNSFDPVIELYDPSGELLDNDDNSMPDGRNAYLTYTVPLAGEYTVHVVGANHSAGEYVLTFSGATGPPAPLYVEAIAPTDTAVLLTYPAEILVEFNDFILPTSLDPSDLTVGGIPAESMTLLDGRHVSFSAQSANMGDGEYHVAMAAGSVMDLQGTPVQSFSSSFFVASDQDTDGDGLSDAVEKTGEAFDPLTPTDPEKWDSDGDEAGDGWEAKAGTNPMDLNSYLRITSVAQRGQETVVAWLARSNKAYNVRYDETMLESELFTNILVQTTADGPASPPWYETIHTYADPTGSETNRRFYVIEVLP